MSEWELYERQVCSVECQIVYVRCIDVIITCWGGCALTISSVFPWCRGLLLMVDLIRSISVVRGAGVDDCECDCDSNCGCDCDCNCG